MGAKAWLLSDCSSSGLRIPAGSKRARDGAPIGPPDPCSGTAAFAVFVSKPSVPLPPSPAMAITSARVGVRPLRAAALPRAHLRHSQHVDQLSGAGILAVNRFGRTASLTIGDDHPNACRTGSLSPSDNPASIARAPVRPDSCLPRKARTMVLRDISRRCPESCKG
jgi:hypothetical protein